jgi:hypothetical protein
MDAVEVDTEDLGKSWTVWSSKQGFRGTRLAVFSEFSSALIYADELSANISKDRHLVTK